MQNSGSMEARTLFYPFFRFYFTVMVQVGAKITLLIGVNIGGLGTLIASMASMISLEYYKKTSAANSKKYIACFTKYNLIFLVLELVTAQLAGC